jgi:hypothetical protein
MSIPARHLPTPAIRERFGERVDRAARFLTRSDPAGDAAVESLSGLKGPERETAIDRAIAGERTGLPGLDALSAQLHERPFWLDVRRAEEGGELIRRSGFFGGVVLAFKSLMSAYCAPAGNKPLTFSARLEEDTQRRLGETGRFMDAVCQPAGLLPGSPGFRATFRVRLVHAQVRRMLLRSDKWDSARWGVPINQFDMAATGLLFGHVLVLGLRQMGFRVSDREHGAAVHLWRAVSWQLGVEDELLAATPAEADALWSIIGETQGEPDEDSRKLAWAIIRGPERDARTAFQERVAPFAVQLNLAFTRLLVGTERAEALGLPRSPVGLALPVLRRVISAADTAVRVTPLGREAALRAGQQYWNVAVNESLQGGEALFDLPSLLPRLGGRPSAR